jgi:phosphatidylethanolamine/phosphatidyl-N-methylethanolamine N-methyltransferase
MRYLQTSVNFLKELRGNFGKIGAVLPSSRFLAKAMTQPLREPRRPARILEVGAGTGAITGAVIRCLQPGDQFDAVEINNRFVDILHCRLATEWGGCPQVKVIHGPVEEVAGDGCYQFIVSCLPLNIFPTTQVRQIFKVFSRLLAPGGTLTFFEYTWIRQLKSPFVNRRERRRLYRVGRIVGSYVKNYQFRQAHVLVNVPPATVRHLHLAPAATV